MHKMRRIGGTSPARVALDASLALKNGRGIFTAQILLNVYVGDLVERLRKLKRSASQSPKVHEKAACAALDC
jgi:hypothetical protein